jgi:hypothetical protein
MAGSWTAVYRLSNMTLPLFQSGRLTRTVWIAIYDRHKPSGENVVIHVKLTTHVVLCVLILMMAMEGSLPDRELLRSQRVRDPSLS